MNRYTFRLLKFEDDGVIPNSKFPVVVYSQVADVRNMSDWLERRFALNGWTNNWRDVVLTYDHFHSTTHEVLGIGKGEVTLQIGGTKGIQLRARAGDVIILPAGVGHYSFPQNEAYEVVGGYPDGRSWDMCTGKEKERGEILQRISKVPLPFKDPVYGESGELPACWS
jgi:uncharacterized protein YjlB